VVRPIREYLLIAVRNPGVILKSKIVLILSLVFFSQLSFGGMLDAENANKSSTKSSSSSTKSTSTRESLQDREAARQTAATGNKNSGYSSTTKSTSTSSSTKTSSSSSSSKTSTSTGSSSKDSSGSQNRESLADREAARQLAATGNKNTGYVSTTKTSTAASARVSLADKEAARQAAAAGVQNTGYSNSGSGNSPSTRESLQDKEAARQVAATASGTGYTSTRDALQDREAFRQQLATSDIRGGYDIYNRNQNVAGVDRDVQMKALDKAMVASRNAAEGKSSTFMKTYYKDVYSSYYTRGLDPTSQALGAGPANDMLRRENYVSVEEKAYANKIDEKFRNVESFMAYAPGQLSHDHLKALREAGEYYEFTDIDLALYGIDSSLYIEGNLKDLEDIGMPAGAFGAVRAYSDNNKPLFDSTVPGGIMSIALDHPETLNPDGSLNIDELMATRFHEGLHAGVNASLFHATVQKNVKVQGVALAVIEDSASEFFGFDIPEGEYSNSVNEAYAFMSSGQRDHYESHLREAGLSADDATEVADAILNSPTFEYMSKTLNDFAKEQNKARGIYGK